MMALAFDCRRLSASWLEQRRARRLVLLSALIVGLVFVMAGLVISLNVFAVGALLGCVGLAVMVARPRWGLYALLGLVIFFDGMNQDSVMMPGWYIFTSLQTTFHLSGGIVIPFEMLLLLMTFVWLAQDAMRQHLQFRGGAFSRTIVSFALAIVAGLVRGLVGGANIDYMFWESRFLLSAILAYFLTTNLIQTRGHLRALMLVVFVVGGASTIEGIYRRYVLISAGVMGTAQEVWYSHDGAVFWGSIVMLVVAQQVFGAPRWQRVVGPVLGLLTLLAMMISERRAGLVALFVALAFFVLSLYSINRKAFFKIGIPAVLLAAVYLPLFWNAGGALGQPTRAIRSISSPDPRDAASNAWRDLEAINVRATIASDPLLGIGFGRPFLQVVAVPDISGFVFWDYEAHHDILWIWMKTGALGFTIFFALILGVIARSIWLARVLPHPELKVFAIVAMSGCVMSVVFCYVDLGLVGSRIPMLLGVLSGGVGVLDRLRD